MPYQTGTARPPVPPSPGTSIQTTVLFFSASSSTAASDPVGYGGSSSRTASGTRPTSSPPTSRASSWSWSESTATPCTSSVKVSILLEPRRVIGCSALRQTTSPLGASSAIASRYQPPAPDLGHTVHLVGEGVDLVGAAQGDRLLGAAPDDVAVGREQRHRLAVPAARARSRPHRAPRR